ncbi:regulator of nonsense transcripts UPF3 isoform X1 [Cinnamomum micranthum f. kanehirae]|uniref:Regulator of nonsense transcripts UPF3 isoform X1 n=1 Tax=Cinnamomum micranthum f. kanehirae TaxID=337451 RepID=A0A443PHT3_9MAGN|nr:regulator of nonsense transcripts UPF3 isoform X1 [Cinnamomum micranthum f. kanehirae]
MHMKDRIDRTKAVLRHLPPGISQAALMEQIDARFASRYRWFCFRSGNNSQKNQRHARAYIDFNNPEDVIEFADFFTGHVFVNEKGAQFKTIVEYAPSQRAPKPWSKRDGREGTIFKDPEYLEFLDRLAKPVENLPSAEIQLERKEAEERAGGQKETLIVTPLMDFVRQKRAAKMGSQRQSTNGKLSRRGGGISPGNSSSASTKRASEKRRGPTSMYVLRDSTKNTSGKEGSTYLLMQRRDDQQLSEKSVAVGAATEILEDEAVPAADYGTTTGVYGAIDIGKKRLLLKGKEKELSLVSGVVSPQQSITVRNSQGSAAFKQNQRRERDVSGRIIRSILSNKDARHNQSPVATHQSEQQMQTVNLEKDKRPPRPNNIRSILKDHVSPHAVISDGDTKRASDDKFVANDLHNVTSVNEKQDRRTRNKDRPDRGVWTPLRRSDGSHATDGSLPSSSLHAQFLSDSFEGMTISQRAAVGVSKTGDDVVDTDSSNNSFTGGKPRSMDGGHNSRLGRGGGLLSANEFTLCEMKADMPNASKSGEIKVIGTGLVNGSHRHVVRRGPHGLKEIDGSPNFSEGKPSKRGGTGYGSHEKQVWVQKSGSGS